MSKKKKTNKIEGPLIYCGPSFNGELQQFSIYKDGVPKHIESYIEGCPEIERMFYPTSELIKVRNRIKEKGSMEHQMYTRILEYQREVR